MRISLKYRLSTLIPTHPVGLGLLLTFVIPVLLPHHKAITLYAASGPDHGPFYLRSNLGRCLTYGTSTLETLASDGNLSSAVSGPSVYIDDCDRAGPIVSPRLQAITTREVNDRHEVILMAGEKVLGVSGSVLAASTPLEKMLPDLQRPPKPSHLTGIASFWQRILP
jgi:hypothetical protein